jgi:membrane associated rhomboid family serine protease
MFIFKNITFSKILLFIVTVLYLLNIIFNEIFTHYLVLYPNLILENFEFWRILSFPILINSFDGLLIFLFSFNFFAPKLEKLIGHFRFFGISFILSIIFGSLFVLLFSKINIAFSGFDHIGIFVITLYLLFKPKSNLNIFKTKVNVLPITLLFIVLWICVKIYIYGLNDFNEAITSISSIIFGVISSVVVYFKMKSNVLSAHNITKSIIEEAHNYQFDNSNFNEQKSQNFLYNIDKLKKSSKENQLNDFEDDMIEIFEKEMELNEDKLNEILDKINSKGKDSLTIFERKFLIDYSKKI